MVLARQEITSLLTAWRTGDETALNRLIPLVYDELRRLARAHMARQPAGHTLQTTALVHEVYLRLLNCRQVSWQDRAHFFAVVARLMRRILVDVARSYGYQKRGGGRATVSLEPDMGGGHNDGGLVELDEALQHLADLDPRKANVVELKFFGGLTVPEIAEVLQVSQQTVLRDWSLAKSWLRHELRHIT
jgi:RNA polymerase sigma-70 factor (ECF subfamily)